MHTKSSQLEGAVNNDYLLGFCVPSSYIVFFENRLSSMFVLCMKLAIRICSISRSVCIAFVHFLVCIICLW